MHRNMECKNPICDRILLHQLEKIRYGVIGLSRSGMMAWRGRNNQGWIQNGYILEDRMEDTSREWE